MHIPDGFIPLWQCGIYYIILFIALYFSLKLGRKNLDEKMCTFNGSISSRYICNHVVEYPDTHGEQVATWLVEL